MLKYSQSPLTTFHLHPLIYMERLALKSYKVQIIGFEEGGNVGNDREHMAPFPAFSDGDLSSVVKD